MYHERGWRAASVRGAHALCRGAFMAFVLAVVLFVVVLGVMDRALPWPADEDGGTAR